MNKTERNKIIVAEARRKIASAGLSNVLDIFPVTTPFTKRPRYWTDSNGVHLFKVHLWDINELSDEDCSAELDVRIRNACAHFNL